jgi:hypothetical protein
MGRLRILATCFLVLAASAPAAAGPARLPAGPPSPALGVAVNLGPAASAEERQAVLDAVRRTGASFFALELSWSRAEPRPGDYRLEELTRTARLLRQSGAMLHLDLPLVTETARDVPADLKGVPFDDPRLSLRLGRLIDALAVALLDFQSLSLGQGADAYFASRPDELRAFLRLFDGAVPFLKKKAPQLLVGVTTAAPDESPAPEVAAALHRRSPARFYAYAPFVRGEPFVQRSPGSLEADWTALMKSAGGHPIGFPVVSFSSSAENGSSPEKQAEFVHRLLRFVAKADGRKLLFVRYVALRDSPEDPAPPGAPVAERRQRAFLSHRGLETGDGLPKPAWMTWIREAPAVKR